MSQLERANVFAALHKKGDPIVLYNIWDAGTAQTVVKSGAAAIATGSASVAMAHGYPDGEKIPTDLLFTVAERISASVDVPLSVDFEGGYAVEPAALAEKVSGLIATGAVGLNFEDQVVGGDGLHPIDLQADRIRAIRAAADSAGIPFWINARSDLFLKDREYANHGELVAPAAERAAAYAEAGANSFFAPWLKDADLIGKLVEAVDLPVNIMWYQGCPSLTELAELGVARVSYGPGPYRIAMGDLAARFEALE